MTRKYNLWELGFAEYNLVYPTGRWKVTTDVDAPFPYLWLEVYYGFKMFKHWTREDELRLNVWDESEILDCRKGNK